MAIWSSVRRRTPIPSLRARFGEKEKGFTLIEMLVVCVIIGILAGIAIPIFMNQRAKAIDASLRSDARTMATQMESAYTDNLGYPTSVGGTLPDLTVGTEQVRVSANNDVRVWLDDVGGDAFCIRVTNPNGTAPATGFVWRSDGGGPQPAGSDCSAYPTVVL